MSTGVAAAIEAKRGPASAGLDLIDPGADLIVGIANAAPDTVLDAIEGGAGSFEEVSLHQMVPLRPRRYINGEVSGLRHVSWFLSPIDREAFAAGNCDLVPNNFSDVPRLMAQTTQRSLALVSCAPPDRHGFFSLGPHAEYMAAMIGEVPFFVEANAQTPRTFGENQIHVSQLAGWCEADYPLKDLGIHTELLSDGFIDLIEGGAANGSRKRSNRNKAVTTTVLGSNRLYELVRENPGIELWPVDCTNDPRRIGSEPRTAAINATLEVDFLGQCASESLGSHYWSSSGGQVDYTRGVLFSEEGQSFIVLHSTPHDESGSRIVPRLHPGAAVTSHKNIVDKVVTEYGVAELRGAPVAERVRKLIAIAHPRFRDELEAEGREMGYL